MIHFGFSYMGLIFLLMLFIPNIIWTKHKPKDYEQYVVNENKLSKLQLFNGDVNSDGAVNVVDATLIQKYIVSDKS